MLGKWTSRAEPSADSVPAAVYEDPVCTGSTRVTTENVQRLIDPGDGHKMSEEDGSGKKEHLYEGIPGGQNCNSTVSDGRWWPVWLVCRTKGGWWTICWYQLLDGNWVVEFWWYADVHVHLLEAVH